MSEIKTEFELSSGRSGVFRRAGLWAAQTGLGRRLVVLLFSLAIIAGVLSFLVLSEYIWQDASAELTWWILIFDVALLLSLAAVIMRAMVRLWARRRAGAAGSQLHVRVVTLFVTLTVAPAIIVVALTAVFFNAEMRGWFDDTVQQVVSDSTRVADAYLDEHYRVIEGDALRLKSDLENHWRARGLGRRLRDSDVGRLGAILAEAVYARRFNSVILFDARGQILARRGITTSNILFSSIRSEVLDAANSGRVAIFSVPGDRIARVHALVRLRTFPETYLYIDRLIDESVLEYKDNAQAAVRRYEELRVQRAGIEITLIGLFVLVTGLLLLAAVGIGLGLANRLAAPLGRMVEAAEQVRKGNLDVHLVDEDAESEFGVLSRAFNRMTRQLSEQRRELVDANRQLDERRRFTEAVLTGVSAGVIGLDADGKINYPNRSAVFLLDRDIDELVGLPLVRFLPEVSTLLDRVGQDTQKFVEGQIQVDRENGTRTLLVRISVDQGAEGALGGFVVTFDDMSELLQAQRTAAWADVAQRIAHEIKNPLTPIQLSAERLKRKYLEQIHEDPETFAQCTDTIVRQVGDIGRMVDEFSSFARMPTPKMAVTDLVLTCKDAVFLQRNAQIGIKITHEMPDKPLFLTCDARLVSQAVTNLLQNAIDAITGANRKNEQNSGGGEVKLTLRLEDDMAVIAVLDNGPGLPDKVRDRLTEPYVTTRAEGTGLGLAIVNKIMEDHDGELRLSDRDDGITGACVELRFPSNAEIELTAQAT